MNLYALYSLLKPLARLGMALCCVGLAWYVRSPFVASIRDIVLYSVGGLTLFLILLDAPLASRRRGEHGGLRTAIFVFALLGLTVLFIRQGAFLRDRSAVFAASPQALRDGGRFVVRGYRDVAEMEELIRRGGVAGVYITSRNVRGKTRQQVAEQIARFQKLAEQADLPPLLIAADQEGGVVNHLKSVMGPVRSPAAVVKASGDATEAPPGEIAARNLREHARLQAARLRELGINVNFAPVVDLPAGDPVPGDRLTRIHSRALGRSPDRVAAIAEIYARELRRGGIMPTLKHFPGLGGVRGDTHTLPLVPLDTDLERLRKHDWVPFRRVLARTDAMMMLAHVRLTALDPDTPASYSPAVLNLIRGDWKHRGILITDDFSMTPVTHGPHGVGPAAQTALGAGMDLILIAYDVELYYPIMSHLLRAGAPSSSAARFMATSAARLGDLRESFRRKGHPKKVIKER